jgi:hypothetical protein
VKQMSGTDPVKYDGAVRDAVQRGVTELMHIHGTTNAQALAEALTSEIDTYLPDWAATDHPDYLTAASDALTEVWLMLGLVRFRSSVVLARRWAEAGFDDDGVQLVERCILHTHAVANLTGDWHWATQALARMVRRVLKDLDASWQPPQGPPPADIDLSPDAN